MEIFPVGSRLWAEEIMPVDDMQVRAKAANIYLVEIDTQKPMPTSARVVAIGNDPLLMEMVKIGDIVFFNKYAGEHIYVKAVKYRVLSIHDITSVAHGTPEELAELNSPASPSSSSS